MGDNKGGIPAWLARLDKVLDVSNRYVTALKSAFIRFQTPPPNAVLPPAHLLPALQFLVQKTTRLVGLLDTTKGGCSLFSPFFFGSELEMSPRITDELDAKAGKLCLRAISQDDIDALLQSDPTVVEQPLDIEQFDEIARKVLKRVALGRGKRLGLFMVGGILVVHLLKGTVNKLPYIGPTVGAVINALMPTTVLGPAVGIAGAMYM